MAKQDKMLNKSDNQLCPVAKEESSNVSWVAVKRRRIWIIFKTLVLINVWIAMGMSQVLPAATLPDLRARLKISIAEAGRAIAMFGFGGMIGAPLGCIADRFKKQRNLILSILVVLSGAFLALKPVCGSLWPFMVLCFVEGISWNCVNAVGNPLMVELWGRKSSAPLQALHFGWPVGSMIGPLLAYNFVSKVDNTNISPYHQNTSQLLNASTVQMTLMPETNTLATPDDAIDYIEDTSRIEIAYGIVAVYCIAVGLLFTVFHFKQITPRHTSDNTNENMNWKDVFSPSKWADGDATFGISIVVLVMLFYFLKVTTGKALYMFGVSYAVESHLQFSTQEGTLFSAACNLGSTLGRGTGIIIAGFIPVDILVFILVYGQGISTILILVWGIQNRTSYLVLSALFRAFSSPVWPCGYAWTDRYIILFSIVVGLVDLVAKFAEAIFSYILAYMYNYTYKETIFYVSATAGVLQSVLLIFMSIYARKHGSRFKN